jgi:hypothetical protein
MYPATVNWVYSHNYLTLDGEVRMRLQPDGGKGFIGQSAVIDAASSTENSILDHTLQAGIFLFASDRR